MACRNHMGIIEQLKDIPPKSKMTVDMEVESVMNYQTIHFDEGDRLQDELNVFIYWHDNKGKFSIEDCANETGINPSKVNFIYRQYLMIKEHERK